MFQMVERMQKSNSDPKQFLNQLMSKYTPEQMNSFRKYASGFGFTDKQLDELGIKTK